MTKKPGETRDPTDTSHPLYDPTKDPTHPFYEGDKAKGGQKPDRSDKDAYKVGPGFPPNEHKWKKGCPSPYPKGRPKKAPSMKPEIRKIFEDALNEKIHVKKADKKIILTRLAMGFEQLAIQFAKGDRYARRDVFTYAAILGVDVQGKEVVAEALGIDNQAIVDAAFQRYQQQLSQRPTPADHVKAPPDLIDDDVAKPEPKEAPPLSRIRRQRCPSNPGSMSTANRSPATARLFRPSVNGISRSKRKTRRGHERAHSSPFARKRLATTGPAGHPGHGFQGVCRLCVWCAPPGDSVQAELAHRRNGPQGLSGSIRRGEAADHRCPAAPPQVDYRIGRVAGLVSRS